MSTTCRSRSSRSTSTPSTAASSRRRGSGSPSIPQGLLTNPAPGVETLLSGGSSDVRISRRELVKTAEITEELLDQLESFGLVRPRTGSKHYDADALVIAKVAGEMSAYGLEPRHLRQFKTAADREVGLVEQMVAPIRRSREDGAEGRAAQTIDELAVLSVRLHAVAGQGRPALPALSRRAPVSTHPRQQ